VHARLDAPAAGEAARLPEVQVAVLGPAAARREMSDDDRIGKALADCRNQMRKSLEALVVLEALLAGKLTPGQQAFKLMGEFTTAWAKKHGGRKYPVAGAKEMSILKRLLKSTSFEDLVGFLPGYFASKDPFVVNNGFTIGIFASQVPRLVSSRTRTSSKDAERWWEECTRTHGTPNCESRTAHELRNSREAVL
jgi:hypothetical protein